MKRGTKRTPPEVRFQTKYRIDEETGCWLWTGALNNKGYGTIGETIADYTTKHHYAHRLSYTMHKGPIPDGLVVDHMCNVRNCVNPDHLQVLTNRENIERSPSPIIQRRLARICKRGHDLADEANVYRRPDNGRIQCRACIRLRWQKKPAA